MRLIDADKIKQSVTNEMLKAELNSPVYCTLECVIADIDNQPTAYNVDKVVEQVRELHGICNKCLNNKNSIATCATFCDMGKELETIKSGGIE